MDHPAFLSFCEKHGDDVATDFLGRLADMQWSDVRSKDGIAISDVHQHNACNHTISGTFDHAGESFGFVIESGDWAGTVVRDWGPADDIACYDPPKPTVYTYVPNNPTLKFDRPGLWEVFLQWRKQPWFEDKVRGYNYDRHFAPGGKTESYYRDWASSKGLRIVDTEEAQRIIDQPVSEAPAFSAEEIQAAWEAL